MNIKNAEKLVENRHNVIGEEGKLGSPFSKYSIAFLTKTNEKLFGYSGKKGLIYGITRPDIEGDFYNLGDHSITFEAFSSEDEGSKEITIEKKQKE